MTPQGAAAYLRKEATKARIRADYNSATRDAFLREAAIIDAAANAIEALTHISAQEAPNASAAAKRMGNMARAALRAIEEIDNG